jgi:hypothetical protein
MMIIFDLGKNGMMRLRFRPAYARRLSGCPRELSTKETDDSKYRANFLKE